MLTHVYRGNESRETLLGVVGTGGRVLQLELKPGVGTKGEEVVGELANTPPSSTVTPQSQRPPPRFKLSDISLSFFFPLFQKAWSKNSCSHWSGAPFALWSYSILHLTPTQLVQPNKICWLNTGLCFLYLTLGGRNTDSTTGLGSKYTNAAGGGGGDRYYAFNYI